MTVATFTLNLLGVALMALSGYFFLGVIPVAIIDSLDKRKEAPEE